MSLAISPKHTTDFVKDGWALDKKIEVFIARVEGWQLGVAREMVDKQVSHRGFALLLIVTSYFEMIAKYREGFIGERSSAEYFKKGVRLVFPTVDQTMPNADDLLDSFYTDVRNGLYHLGRTGGKVLITGDIPYSLGYNTVTGQIAINPDQLVFDLQIKFAEYAAELRNQANTTLRTNFERRFDFDDK